MRTDSCDHRSTICSGARSCACIMRRACKEYLVVEVSFAHPLVDLLQLDVVILERVVVRRRIQRALLPHMHIEVPCVQARPLVPTSIVSASRSLPEYPNDLCHRLLKYLLYVRYRIYSRSHNEVLLHTSIVSRRCSGRTDMFHMRVFGEELTLFERNITTNYVSRERTRRKCLAIQERLGS